jgi:hypothetical protein
MQGLTLCRALQAHERRLKQFKNLASSADARMIAQDFVEENMSKNQPQLSTEPGTSKRAEKKVRHLLCV